MFMLIADISLVFHIIAFYTAITVTVTSECGFTLAHDCNTALGKSHLPYVV
jgi:hypothetical protein